MRPSRDISRIIRGIKNDIRDLEAEQTSRDFIIQLRNETDNAQADDTVNTVNKLSGNDIYAQYGGGADEMGKLLIED
jgi:Sec-independent protein translocase protein TatA